MTDTAKPQFEDMPPDLLLVDDDEAFCLTLASALKRRGYRVHVASDINSAVDLSKEVEPAYAIIDLCIGTESGLDLVKQLRTLDDEMRIVMLTGYASIATAVEAIKLGALHYLTKPADVSEILEALQRNPEGNSDIPPPSEPMSVRRLEWEHLQKVLREHDGNISAAARALGMYRRTLQRKLKKKPVSN